MSLDHITLLYGMGLLSLAASFLAIKKAGTKVRIDKIVAELNALQLKR